MPQGHGEMAVRRGISRSVLLSLTFLRGTNHLLPLPVARQIGIAGVGVHPGLGPSLTRPVGTVFLAGAARLTVRIPTRPTGAIYTRGVVSIPWAVLDICREEDVFKEELRIKKC